jgi:acetolactate synthase-1/3 small subunit
MDRYILSVLVKNHSGVLSRIAGLFSRRGYNIDSLSVGETEDEHVSRMTIVLRGDHTVLEQITKQLAKLIDVLHIKELKPSESVYRELLLFKITADAAKRSEVVQIADIFKAKIIDVDSASISMEITGDQEKISAFIRLVEPFGIKEIVRAGMCAIGRGDETISDDMNGKEL